MSYCRWSSDNWRCDLYCYAHCDGGYTTHVAGNRVVGDIPPEPELRSPLPDDFMQKHNAVMDFLKDAERAPIGLPHDGETFSDPDLRSFLERLVTLRAAGYNFPDYVLDDVREEIDDAEMDDNDGGWAISPTASDSLWESDDPMKPEAP